MRRLCGEGSGSYLGEICPCGCKPNADEAELKVNRGRSSRGKPQGCKGYGEGPNEKDSHEICRLAGQCIRSLGNRGARGQGAVKLHLFP